MIVLILFILFLQTCFIDMAVSPLDNETVKLFPGNLKTSQDANMAIFRLVEGNLVSKRFNEDKRGISMVVILKRKITSEMMTTYFPTLLLTAITFATTFFKPFFFEAGLSVNLTTMLVMTTIFISKMEGLPPTSDIKMIDIWLILCQMVPFAEVVLLTAMEYHRKDKTKKKAKKKSKKSISSKGLSNIIVSANENQDHYREDDLEQKRKSPSQMSLDGYDEEDSERKCYRSCWKPDLKTMGRCNLSLSVVFSVWAMAEFILSFQKRKCYRLWCWQVTTSTLPLPVISILIIDVESYLILLDTFILQT